MAASMCTTRDRLRKCMHSTSPQRTSYAVAMNCCTDCAIPELFAILLMVGVALAIVGLILNIPVRDDLAGFVLLNYLGRKRQALRAKRLRFANRDDEARQ